VFEQTVRKGHAKKVRRIYNGKIIGGFAGAAADAFALFGKFAEKLEKYNGNLTRASVELAKDWRTDKQLRRLEALLVVSDGEENYLLSGTGDVIEPDDGIVGIGSGGSFVLAAAKALVLHSDLDARGIAEEAMKIAATICVYTNENITYEEI